MSVAQIAPSLVDSILDACPPGKPSPALRDLLDEHDAWTKRAGAERVGIVEGETAWYVVRAHDSGDCDSRKCASEAEARRWMERWS